MNEIPSTISFEISCPFCSRKIYVDSEQCVILHIMPPCSEFLIDRDPADFLAAMTKRLGN